MFDQGGGSRCSLNIKFRTVFHHIMMKPNDAKKRLAIRDANSLSTSSYPWELAMHLWRPRRYWINNFSRISWMTLNYCNIDDLLIFDRDNERQYDVCRQYYREFRKRFIRVSEEIRVLQRRNWLSFRAHWRKCNKYESKQVEDVKFIG